MFRFCMIGLLLLTCCHMPMAQSLNGLWFGRAEANVSGTFNSYLCEITLKKNSKGFSGTLNYFFGSHNFTTPVTAKYWPATKTIELNPFPLITYFAVEKNAPDCIMDGSLTLYVDGADSVLYGQLNPVGKYRNSCPLMTIYLKRENETPGMMEANPMQEQIIESDQEKIAENVLVSDSVKTMPVSELPAMVIEEEKVVKASVEELTKRHFIEGPLIEVDTDTIYLHVYDNGKVDNDTVSVFFNRFPVALNQALSLKPLIFKLGLETGMNEIAMFAVNLGDLPPNTALCLIYAKDKRYDINLSSTLASNGTVRVLRKDKNPETPD